MSNNPTKEVEINHLRVSALTAPDKCHTDQTWAFGQTCAFVADHKNSLVAAQELSEGGLHHRAMTWAQGIHSQRDGCHAATTAHCLQINS